jgi:hypothetical protein
MCETCPNFLSCACRAYHQSADYAGCYFGGRTCLPALRRQKEQQLEETFQVDSIPIPL